MNPKIEAFYDPKSIEKFQKKIEKTFNKIATELQNIKNFEPIVTKTKSGLRENRQMTFENELKYAEMKLALKNQGYIRHSTPLSVTGQLIDDFYMGVHSVQADELSLKLAFQDIPRLRPTYMSMAKVYRGEEDNLTYKESSSEDVVKDLVRNKGYPILESVSSVYGRDYVLKVHEIIKNAFK